MRISTNLGSSFVGGQGGGGGAHWEHENFLGASYDESPDSLRKQDLNQKNYKKS